MQISTGTIVWEILIQFVLHFVFVHMTSFSLSTRVRDQSCSGEVAGNEGLGLLQAECGEKERYYFASDIQNNIYSKIIVL